MIKAVIFDLDGVICHTDEYHYRAWKSLADELGIYFDRRINNRLRGVSRNESLEIILERSRVQYSEQQKQEFAAKKNETYKALLNGMTPADLPSCVKDSLIKIRSKGLKLAIGSSSKNAPLILERIGLNGFFDAVSDGNNITNSKPHPEVFVKAAQMVDTNPEYCVVIEDAIAGIQAARAANMKAVAIGDASDAKAGDYNITEFGEILSLLEKM